MLWMSCQHLTENNAHPVCSCKCRESGCEKNFLDVGKDKDVSKDCITNVTYFVMHANYLNLESTALQMYPTNLQMKDTSTPVQTPIKDTKSPVTRTVCVCVCVSTCAWFSVHVYVCNFASVHVCTSQAWPTLSLLISPWVKFTSSVLCPHPAPITHTTTDI